MTDASGPPSAQTPPSAETPPAAQTPPSAETPPPGEAALADEASAPVQMAPVGRRAGGRKRRFERSIRLLVLANVVLVAVFATALFLALVNWIPTAGHPQQASASPSPSASPSLMAMGLAHIPTSNACVLCHESGGSAGLKVIPALGHPLEGWRQCLTCHTNPALGRLAPGHEGISESECLNCHKVAQPGPAITQPHSRLQDQHCLDCHGNVAHLPSSMASRKETSCTLCHKPTPLPPPEYPHAANEPLGCRECHQSPEVGGLPIDHALRPDSSCLLCHEIKRASPSPSGSASPTPTAAASPTPAASPASSSRSAASPAAASRSPASPAASASP